MQTYIRDSNGVLINIDDSYYRALLAARESEKKARATNEKLNALQEEIELIKKMLQTKE